MLLASSQERRYSTVACVLLVCIGIAFWGAGSGYYWAMPYQPFAINDYYGQLADAFLKGNTYLDRTDPNTDMSVFEGRIYLYFGPLNGLVRIPERILGLTLSPIFHTVVFLWGATVLFYLCVSHIRRQYYPDGPAWPEPLLTMAFACGTPIAMMAGRAMTTHHQAISLSILTQMGIYYSFLRYLSTGRLKDGLLLGLMLACSMAARATNVILAPGIILGIILHFGTRKAVRSLMAPMAVAAAGGIAHLVYNYVRFHSVTEFGWNYAVVERRAQLTPFQLSLFRGGECLPYHFYLYFLRLPALTSFPPDISTLISVVPWFYRPGENADLVMMDIYSIFFLMPFLLLMPLAVLFSGRNRRRVLMAAFSTCGGVMMIFLLFYRYASLRFTGDFLPAFLLLTFMGTHALLELLPGWRNRILVGLVVMVSWSVLLHWQWLQHGARKARSALVAFELAGLPVFPWDELLLVFLACAGLGTVYAAWRIEHGYGKQRSQGH